MRSEYDFAMDSRKARYFQDTINGRHRMSILENVVDIPLPTSVIVDYLHVPLLGHAKALCLALYRNHMKPKQRTQLDEKIYSQRFPHIFNRKIKVLDQPYLKVTEMRNIFFFCILPMIYKLLPLDTVAHIGIFVAGIRLSKIKLIEDYAKVYELNIAY
ncbi:hypothetical protein I4U23_000012 [Adineta vaga]|nr:hypothetical protein I4U23_000012 [Adineta vaga]